MNVKTIPQKAIINANKEVSKLRDLQDEIYQDLLEEYDLPDNEILWDLVFNRYTDKKYIATSIKSLKKDGIKVI